jgi:hypothetical protein
VNLAAQRVWGDGGRLVFAPGTAPASLNPLAGAHRCCRSWRLLVPTGSVQVHSANPLPSAVLAWRPILTTRTKSHGRVPA